MDIQALISQLNELIKKLNQKQKIVIIATVVAVIALGQLVLTRRKEVEQ